eukprot:CAMPEP_0116879354 /NCGR_PEP_ID=MMETSP0463-20121206/11158_1 /TAXON_ID=181622 /ORGANISM="Strombidinopsis sp, Strain SopsisLIS2011" /LENGTH=58 /DNA_ID=CAMNT_0004528599 /DNA_START=29 /DNA_END=205 /DNA_ORIENTATION=+
MAEEEKAVPETVETRESSLFDFFNNDALSDVELVHSKTDAIYKVHRVILASGSKYMLE